ncbi:hypothetical protein [Streptomyces sp. NPDC050848]|uniref:hypothetical protein n=1 Tax=Streptomyces sp. NPDC050848 TaxID=3155791 RepID=UPI0033ED83B2
MDTEPGADRRERAVDWLASHPDLPHLFARLSELVHVYGYEPDDLIVIPRAEVDRREASAFAAGWAEAMSEELPRIRNEYEKRVADAYAQGQGDARGIRRPQRRVDAGEGDGARVIPLPFTRLLAPPAAVVQAEERIRRERELLDRRPEHELPPDEPQHATAASPRQGEEVSRPRAEEPVADSDVLPTAQESRTRRNAQSVRKVVRGKGGRPIVPPLAGVPVQTGSGADRRPPEDGEAEPTARKGRRLSERAKALEEELAAERAQEAPPEPAP